MTDESTVTDEPEEDLGLLPEEVDDVLREAQGAADDILDIDLSEAPKSPEGDFTLKVLDIEVVFTRDGTKRMAVFFVEIQDPGEFQGRKFSRKYMMSGRGTGFTRDIATAIGQPPDGDRLSLSRSKARGALFQARVAPDENGFPDIFRPKPLG